MTELVNKHDELCKKFLTDISVAKDFLQLHLREDIKTKCDFQTLTIEDGSYIDNDLRKRMSDIVYKMDLLDKTNCAYIYLMVEHQSSDDRLMPIRILRYQLEI